MLAAFQILGRYANGLIQRFDPIENRFPLWVHRFTANPSAGSLCVRAEASRMIPRISGGDT
jgi:hypothetical protein